MYWNFKELQRFFTLFLCTCYFLKIGGNGGNRGKNCAKERTILVQYLSSSALDVACRLHKITGNGSVTLVRG